ncbi:MAG TPA: hypothetical protein VFQ91_18865, partial [Bryobacteraceae bacterium]|nr:hypothetical protein [Bryobacteraceae bacterium]
GAQKFAERVMAIAGSDAERSVDTAFRLALSRTPSAKERAEFQQLATGRPLAEALTQLGVVLFNVNEFIYLE